VTNLGMVLDYAKRGWHVFPLQPQDKIPLSRSRGFKDATTNPTTLKRWLAAVTPTTSASAPASLQASSSSILMATLALKVTAP
jgi:hypothetical protein